MLPWLRQKTEFFEVTAVGFICCGPSAVINRPISSNLARVLLNFSEGWSLLADFDPDADLRDDVRSFVAVRLFTVMDY